MQFPDRSPGARRAFRWPATDEDLLEKARSDAAPDEIPRGIRRLPGSRHERRKGVLVADGSACDERDGP